MTLKAQIDIINNRLAKLPKELKKSKKKADIKAARAVRAIVRKGTPVTKGRIEQGKDAGRRKVDKRGKFRYDGAPEKAGNLRAAIGIIKGLKRAALTYIGVRAGSKYAKDGYYARFIEYGTVRSPARPFWKKSVTPAIPIAKNILVQGAKTGFSNFKTKNTIK
jgi:HK97 gp10 family phage protein